MLKQGIRTIVRLDPLFIHLFQALYGDGWLHKVSDLINMFAAAGVKHIVSSTGRLTKRGGKTLYPNGTSSWQRVHDLIAKYSPLAADKFIEEYLHESYWAGQGYMLRRDLRLDLHRKLKALAESNGMTYATCQELPAKQCDSRDIPHCEGMPLPFARRGLGGKFYPVENCTANCHVYCRGLTTPPCGNATLITPKPLKKSALR
jgi:hypothetical protein